MKYLLKDIQDFMEHDDSFQRIAHQYSVAMKSEEWKFLIQAILIIKGKMMEDLLSYQHTNSEAYEKDVVQRTYYNINQILDFLQSPQLWMRKKNKLKEAYANIASKVSRAKSGGTK